MARHISTVEAYNEWDAEIDPDVTISPDLLDVLAQHYGWDEFYTIMMKERYGE